MLIFDVLGDVGDRAAILAAETQPLDQTKTEEDEGRGEPDRRVGRNEPDEGRCHSHTSERDDEGVLAADLVTEPTEHERAEWADEEADGKDRDRAQECRDRMTLLEELDRENRREAAEDVEVVPLDDVADGCRDDDTAELVERNLGGSSHGPPLV